MLRCLVAAGLMCFGSVCLADLTEEQEGYVASNTLGILYHELGHALIDILDVDHPGKEEDAADTLSILMVDYGYDDASGEQIADDIASTFAIDAQTSRSFFWNAHSSDSKRSENTVCLFYGGDPEKREEFADVWDLADRKRESCIDRRDDADDLWGEVLGEIDVGKRSRTLNFSGFTGEMSEAAKLGARTVKDEVAHLNGWMKLPETLAVRIDTCDEPNAFYDPEHVEIVMCVEYSDYLADQVK